MTSTGDLETGFITPDGIKRPIWIAPAPVTRGQMSKRGDAGFLSTILAPRKMLFESLAVG
jgi:hypothetical protein